MQILLVDDETELTTPLSRVLTAEGYQVDVANNGVQGEELAQDNGYNLLILDWLMPEKSGLELCQNLRSRGDKTPVLFLTAKDTVDDRVQGLDVGADDYIVKPFELREFLARVRALLRRSAEENIVTSSLKLYDLELDINNQIAYRRGRAIELSQRETKLLSYLMQYPEQVLTHQQIYQHLWGEESPPSSNVLAALVRLLRRKLEAPGETSLIHTVYGKGYRFMEET
ncbi:response regulator transcription factor [Euhalothece natronophila Z-M001]|uniref:Response regulator transcription factor n=1 Tax=Euhalothece natronophila Z-M001 TaxID=522448 RepID=A0A5B8NR13_9CHRO|nr:two-component system response regulator RppA [Euhalothece natronophila]QDZ41458.1 response regulator transcription factor [Euhalothece natronophila Z-M001]